MRDHPRDELAEPLMVCSLSLEGTTGGEWNFAGEAAFASEPHVPDWCTPKPKIFGMQSAVVVGPPDEELHTDEHGRVRVQFPWDREGKHDDKSSCWLRVSQDWAGAGWGAVMLPRVGQEVLVGFYEGDPDHPVVVGRVYNENNPVPYELPKHKTKSTWKSDSSPAEKNPAGFNEIMFDDERGKELLYQQAELDRQKLVKAFETERTGRNRLAIVGNNRSAVVGELDATMVGRRHLVRVMDHPVGDDLAIQKQEEPKIEPTDACIDMHVESNKHNHIIFTTGTAKLALSKRHIRLEAKGKISLRAGAGDIIIEGKHVYLNTKTPAAAPDPQPYSPLEPGIFSYETEELALRFAEQTEIDLARSPGASAPQIEARKKLAAGFYRASYPKYSGDRIYSHLNGIDFDESVEEVEIPPRTTLEQYAYPVDPPKEPSLGNYFAPPGATPDELGLNPEGLNKDSGNVEPKPLLVVQSPATPTPALKSTAGPIVDDWSDPNNPYAASGGAEQFNVPDKEAMRPVPPSP